jgi:hypothetical protein
MKTLIAICAQSLNEAASQKSKQSVAN